MDSGSLQARVSRGPRVGQLSVYIEDVLTDYAAALAVSSLSASEAFAYEQVVIHYTRWVISEAEAKRLLGDPFIEGRARDYAVTDSRTGFNMDQARRPWSPAR